MSTVRQPIVGGEHLAPRDMQQAGLAAVDDPITVRKQPVCPSRMMSAVATAF